MENRTCQHSNLLIVFLVLLSYAPGFVHLFGICECWPGGSRCHGLKEKITEEVGIEKTLSMDLIVFVGEDEVTVVQLQLLVPWPLLWRKGGPSCQEGTCTFFQALMLRPLKECLSPNPSYFHLCILPFSNGLHLHIYYFT